ncbi:MAG: O-antigen ligase family protein [Desulfotomaculaceae bacterium]|nr:O-antigen ligase family protein [Desulfotomaculaceae bacterium]
MPGMLINQAKNLLIKIESIWEQGFVSSVTGACTRRLQAVYQAGYISHLLNRNLVGESYAYQLLQKLAGALAKQLKIPELLRMRLPALTYGSVLALAILALLSFFFLPWKLALVAAGAVLLIIGVFYRTEAGVYAAALLLPFVPFKALFGLAVLTLASLIYKITVRPRFRFYLTPLLIPLLLFFVIMFYATVTSVSFWDSASEFLIPVTGLIYLLVIINTFDNRDKLNNLIFCVAAAGLITAGYAIYQYYTGASVVELRKEWVDLTQNPEIKNRAYAVFENPNLLAQYLVLLATLTLGAAFNAVRTGQRLFYAATFALAAFCLVLTWSRGGWLALVAALLIFAVFKNKLVIHLLVIAGIMAYSAMPQAIISRLSTITSLKDTSNAYRLDTWFSAWDLIKTHWETGVGLGRKAFARVYYTHMINSNVVPHSHNLYLQLISEFGILGLAVFCWLFLGIFRLGLKLSAASDAFTRNLNAGVLGALAGFLTHSVVDYFLWYYKLGIFLWLLVAIILVLEKISIRPTIPERNE